MSNIFSNPQLLRILGRVYYPNLAHEIVPCTIGEQQYQLLVVEGNAITEHPLIDFFEAQPTARSNGHKNTAHYMARAAQRSMGVATYQTQFTTTDDDTIVAPYVQWSNATTWADWQQRFKAQAKALAKNGGSYIDIPRQRRRLTKQVGELRFVYQDNSPEILDRFFEWKSQRYRDTGVQDLWANAKHVEFIRALRESGLLIVSVLYAQDTPIAIHLGLSAEGRCYWWLPTFDSQLNRFSAGRILLEDLLKASFDAGDRQFDFLNGEEFYKYCYATDVRIIRSIGQPSRVQRVKQKVKCMIHEQVSRSKTTLRVARKVQAMLSNV